MVIYHEHQEVPIVEESDVVVCGGGPAGVAAAVAAARAGASVRLLELQGCLGGVWTAGPVCWVIDSANKTGIMAEIGHRLEQRDARYGRGNHYGFDPEAMKLTLEEMCLEAGVRIQLHTRVSAAARQGRRLDMVLTESLSGREAWKAQTFIDCTGNGDLAAYAGCSFEV
jgi:flavin-dependent dehydrogenase